MHRRASSGRDPKAAGGRRLSSWRGRGARVRRLEVALAASEARFDALVAAAADPIVTIDEAGTLVFVNRATELVFGYEPGELLGSPITQLMPERYHEAHRRGLARYLATGERHLDWRGVHLMGRTKQGAEIPLDVSFGQSDLRGRPAFTGILRDASARVRTETALDAERRLLANILDTVESGIVVCDARGVLTHFNQKAREWHGHGPEPLTADTWAERYDLFHADGKTRLRMEEVPLFRALRGEQIVDVEITIVTEGGEPRTVSTNARAMTAPDGRILGAVAVMHDVTFRKHVEEHARQSARLESVGRLAGGVAHEANNQMLVVLGAADFLLSRPNLPDDVVEDLRQIQRAAERTSEITSQLLAFSRKQTLAISAIDLDEVVTGLAPALRRAVGEGVELVIRAEGGSSTVLADEGQLAQILLNLALNARDAMQGAGTLTIETHVAHVTGREPGAHAELRPGTYAMLVVHDTGHGMDGDTMSRIFEPFFTTKRPGEGTGMGLATVYGLVKQFGGHVAVRSAPGRGARFEIHLPLA